MTDNLQYPENVQKEEPIKELLAQIYKELGAISYKIHKEKQVDVYLPRIDILSILQPEQVDCFEGTIFQYLKPVVCFEVHTRSLDEPTFMKWQIEAMGLFLMIAQDLGLHCQDFVGYSIVEHVPEAVLKEIPKEVIMHMDPYFPERPVLVKIAGMIPWYLIFKPYLRYDLFCLPANLMLPDRHEQLIVELKEQRYKSNPMMEKMAVKVLEGFYQKKGATTMLDIASILEKSNEPSFVQFRKCRDMLLNEGRLEGELKAKRMVLIRILKKKFVTIPTKMEKQILQLEDMKKLEELLDQAISIDSIEKLQIG